METQTLLIGVAGFFLSFLVIYLISVFSMREKTFEEVLEEQRKRLEEEERKAKSERRAEKGERKKYRKFKEKPKEKPLSSPPRETQQPPTASNTKILVRPVTEIVVERVSSTTAVPTATSIKTNSPKSVKKAQKSLSDSNNLGGSSSGKNVKPLVARSSASSVPVCMEETIEKNVQVTALEKCSSNKSNSAKESKTARKISPSKQTSPVLSSPAEQQKQKQKQPQPQEQKQPQPAEQQKQKQKQLQPQEQQKQKQKQLQPQEQQKQKQLQPQEQQKQQQKQKQPQPQEQQKQKQPQPQEQQKQKQPQPQEQHKQKQPQPQEQHKQKQPQPQEQHKQKQPQPQEQHKQKQPQPQEQHKQKQPQPQEQQKQKPPQPQEQQKQKQKPTQPQEQKQKRPQEQQQKQEQQKQKQPQQQELQKQQQQKNTNSQTQQNTKSYVEPKSNTKTSKAAKQNANEALEKQILIVEQNQKVASSNEENATKKLSKKAKKAAATIATDTQLEEKSVKDQAPKENFQKRKSGNETGVTQLISSVKGTALNDSEILTLLDLLQSKQNKKSQKSDYVAGLLKQLEEKEKRIIDVTEGEVKAHQVVTGLKQKIVNTEKLYENKIKKLMDENKTLQSQVKKTQLQYEQNMTTLTDQMKQLESNTVTKECYQKIVDEVNKLSVPAIPAIDPAEMASMKQKVQIMEKELNNNVLKLNNSEKKKKKFEDKIKEFETKTKNENKKLEELNLALKNSTNEKALLTEKSNKASETLKATQTECASLKCQLKDKELNNKEAEKNMMNLSKRVKELEEELGIVKQKNMILLEEKLVREKPVKVEVNLGERQEPAGAPNGDVQQESLACTKVALVEHERLLGEKQSEIVRLTAELGNKETETKARVDEKESEIQTLTTSLNTQIGEIEKLREEIQTFKNKNDQCQSLDKSVLMRIFPDISVTESLEHDIWLKSFEVEAAKYIKGLKEISESVSKLEKAEMMKKELEIRLSELEKKLSEAQISKSESVEDLHKQIDTLTAQLKDSTLKYTDLQTNSEGTKTKLEDRLKELESAFSETKTLCMSLKEKLENAPINNSTEEYEKQVETLMVQLKESNETVAKLETQVKKYQNLLKVTDDKLQVLQRSVEDEELKWRREQQTLQKSLLEAQQELEELRKNQVGQTSAQSLEAVNSQTEKEYKLLRLQVEDDEKKVRDLSQTIVKLNGIIKTGQDALSQEQELVCKLKQQLADKNSTESPSAAQEVEEASAVSSNDVGTSV